MTIKQELQRIFRVAFPTGKIGETMRSVNREGGIGKSEIMQILIVLCEAVEKTERQPYDYPKQENTPV
jgi:hypothetical protein